MKPIKVKGVEEWKVGKILNKRKIRGIVKNLVWWKRFMAENNSWKKEKDLENAKEVVVEFKGRINEKVRW